MTSPAFSVVIPVFNGAATIARAIDSVLEQSYAAMEVIVVDDGSDDETAGRAAAFGRRIRYVRRANAGVSAARNLGADLAAGDWLAFLDADDWYYPDRLRWHAEWIERDPGLDFLTGDYDYRRPDGSLISRSMELTEAGRTLLAKAEGRREVVMGSNEMAGFVEQHFGDTHTLSVRRETFRQLGGYPPGRAVCEDVHFLIRLCARSHRVGVICEPMGAYCIHGESATRRDPLGAQLVNVQTLLALRDSLGDASPPIRRGYLRRLRRARLNLAYSLLRQSRGREAVVAVLPSLRDASGFSGFRDVASITWNAVRQACSN